MIFLIGKKSHEQGVLNQNRTVSVEEDEGFCDSDDADKNPVLSLPEANNNQKPNHETKKKRNKKKSQLNKKVSFKTDIDEIPGSLQSSNSNPLPILALKTVQHDSDPLRHDTSFNPTAPNNDRISNTGKKNSDKMAVASVYKTANKSNPPKKKKKSRK